MAEVPLSAALSRLLVAFTIELDNLFERRFLEAVPDRHFRVSVVMWSNFLRLVGHGVSIGELAQLAGMRKPRLLSTLGGMERWRYVRVAKPGEASPPTDFKRDGWGSARGLRDGWVISPTAAGVVAQEIWPPLFAEIERRWEERFGASEIDDLRRSLSGIIEQLGTALPEYLPIVTGTNGMVAETAPMRRHGTPPAHLLALLSQVLLAYTLDFETDSATSLPLSADILRVLDDTGIDVRELPRAAAVSPEATTMALNSLRRTGLVVVEVGRAATPTTIVRLTSSGRRAKEAIPGHHAVVDQAWRGRFGERSVNRLRTATETVLEQREGTRMRLALGLEPYPDGWRSQGRYLTQTRAMLEEPWHGLPEYPMVLHRGGWPDGS